MTKVTIDDIDALLPQTQCGECDFNGCRPYAQAILTGDAEINRCPPGGEETLQALGQLLERTQLPALKKSRPPAVAYIDESECIGCTKCIQACPVDAIIGTAKKMHVILTDECTGCELCIEPCPVDCIHMQRIAQSQYDKTQAKSRYFAKTLRLARTKPKPKTPSSNSIKDYIQQALLRKGQKDNPSK